MIKLVVFDFDGVLVDSNEAWAGIYSKAAKATGMKKDIAYDDIKEHYGKPYIDVLRAAYPEITDDENTVERMYSNFLDLASSEDFGSSFRLIKGARKTLDELKGRFMLAVGSGNTKKMLNKFMRKFRLADYFRFVVTIDDVKRGKPNPDMLIKAIRHFNVKPEEAVYVGDSASDVMAAKRAGMHSVAVLTGALDKKEAMNLKPDYIVEDVSGVPEVLSCM